MSLKKWKNLNPERKIRRLRDKLLLLETNYDEETHETVSEMINIINKDPEIKLNLSYAEEKNKFEIQRLLAETEKYLNINISDMNLCIKTEDGKRKIKKLPIKVFLNGLRSAFNAGSIIRTCEAFGVEEIILEGYTPGKENRKVCQTSMGTHEKIKIMRTCDGIEKIEELKKSGYRILALELTSKSIPLNEYNNTSPCVIMLGNEALGLEKKYLQKADAVLEIPLRGWKNSLNVASAFAIAAYDISLKIKKS